MARVRREWPAIALGVGSGLQRPAGVGATHIRPGLFADNLLVRAAPSFAAEGKIYLPFGEGPNLAEAML